MCRGRRTKRAQGVDSHTSWQACALSPPVVTCPWPSCSRESAAAAAAAVAVISGEAFAPVASLKQSACMYTNMFTGARKQSDLNSHG